MVRRAEREEARRRGPATLGVACVSGAASRMKVVVLGATGVVGRAAAEHLAAVADGGVVAVSRRRLDLDGVVHAPVDLADGAAADRAFRSDIFAGTTHVVYAVLQESDDLL